MDTRTHHPLSHIPGPSTRAKLVKQLTGLDPITTPKWAAAAADLVLRFYALLDDIERHKSSEVSTALVVLAGTILANGGDADMVQAMTGCSAGRSKWLISAAEAVGLERFRDTPAPAKSTPSGGG